MDHRSKLFKHKELYDHEGTDRFFVNAVKKNVYFHRKNCNEYRKILKDRGYNSRDIKSVDDLYKLPPIPTLYLKHHPMKSMPYNKMLIKATSSGTKGKKSLIGYDTKGLYYGAHMVMKTGIYHKLFSPRPTNYIIFGYQPDKDNHTVISKTALGATFFAPALNREYALKYKNEQYNLNIKGLKRKIINYSKKPFPVRLIGFPAYTYSFLKELDKEGIHIKLHKDSKVLLGGGWKQFYMERPDKEELYKLLYDVLGIRKSNCREFFGAVEHPMVYCDCENHHFHVPIYSRVIIRDVDTMLPVENGKPGLLNLITPMMDSMPITSIMTDDLAVLHDGKECGCGIIAPYFDIIGRVGVSDIKTCVAGALEYLEDSMKGGKK